MPAPDIRSRNLMRGRATWTQINLESRMSDLLFLALGLGALGVLAFYARALDRI
jgi:hypothetical protein